MRTSLRFTQAALAVSASAALVLTGLTVPATAASPPTSPASSPDAAHRAVQEALEAEVRQGVPGALAVAERHGWSWSGTAGVADLRTGRQRLARDHFRSGSITKTFVATTLLQIEAEGGIDLDDTVERWLPGLVRGNGHDGRVITVRQLLNHTSGMFDYTQDEDFASQSFGGGFLEHRYDTWRPEQLVEIAMGHRPTSDPGVWKYSNTNYVLAGMIIEKVTGNSYAREVQRRILRPLRLRSTVLPGTDARMPRPSGRAYSKLSADTSGPTYDVTELNPSLAGAAGELLTSAADLNTFYRALFSGQLLGPDQLKEMTTTVSIPGAPGYSYGLGIMRIELSCKSVVWGHSGGIHGSLSDAVVSGNGRHALALNFNADWTGRSQPVVEAEFCRS
ncbi:serine hydrolase domain-containing protein [Streptomyces sp. NPDC006879]|uniref:serine hydrolase domain-containing protein n=1 Tax=Streptomyces sp. NPDC006879 TaxID=3364767 RepID=UPI0036CF62D4